MSAEKLLVIRGGAVGDFVLTLPALKAHRDRWPDRRVEILGYPATAALGPWFGVADDVRRLEHAALARFFVPGASLDPEWADYFASFDAVVSFLYDPDGYFSASLRRCGVRRLIQGIHKPAEGAGPAALQLAQAFRDLGVSLTDDDLRQRVKTADRRTDVIAIHPGSGSPRKNWGLENWLELSRQLNGRFPSSRLAVFSGEAEESTVGWLTDALKASAIPFDHHHQRPLVEVAATLSEVHAFFGHDSGLSHLAGVLGVPTVALFGATDRAVWAPHGPDVRVVQAPGGQLASLTPAAVLAALD